VNGIGERYKYDAEVARALSLSLPERVAAVSSRALRSGALRPIPTRWETLQEGDATYVVRVIDNLRRKQSARAASDECVKPADPFLDYDPELYVEDIAPAHRVLLNKFNVIERHALIVTRAFVPQTAPLTPGDMQAALGCLAEWDGLLFYNGGKAAGASQPHKHLQMVPRALGPQGIPLEPRIKAALADTAALPFAHAVDRAPLDGPRQALAADWHARYCAQLDRIGRDPEAETVAPYNWLATREWMLAVPRARGEVSGIGINALAFAGAFLVKDQRQLEDLKHCGARWLLQQSTV